MPRKSAVVPVISRQSRVADRPGPASASPFRSHKAANRIVSARAMITKREQEIAALEKALKGADNLKIQRILSTRLLATTNNLRSWQAYICEAEREPRAVIIPTRSR